MDKGLIVKSTGSSAYVRDKNNEILECKVVGKMRLKGMRSTNPVAVGDWVLFERNEIGAGVIKEVCPRKNYVLRRATNLSKEFQVLAANIDLAILVATLKYPDTSTRFIDRFLITCEAYDIPCLIFFNKADLLSESEFEIVAGYTLVYEDIGYKCMISSTEHDLSELEEYIKGKTILLSGHSGVGKSTLLNRLAPDLNLKTSEISTSHKTGKHTTTHAEMHTVNDDVQLIDTPGIKSFGVIDFAREDLYHYFPEIFKHSRECKFNNCIHDQEPGCAVVKAVENGEIEVFRYESYLIILNDPDERYRPPQ